MRVWDGDGDGMRRIDMGAHEFGSFRFGDLNCDGAIDAFDIETFITATLDPNGYRQAYPACDNMLADMNGDGALDAFDIEPFVGLLVAP